MSSKNLTSRIQSISMTPKTRPSILSKSLLRKFRRARLWLFSNPKKTRMNLLRPKIKFPKSRKSRYSFSSNRSKRGWLPCLSRRKWKGFRKKKRRGRKRSRRR
jgi:hypothetical protein